MLIPLKEQIRQMPNFPISGVNFLDISPILSAPDSFQVMLSQMADLVDWTKIDVVIGIESRGFILGAALAARHIKGFIPCRKAGKLPPPIISESYQLEYGSATLEMQAGHGRALIVDDVLATGGTLQATINLAEKSGYQVNDLLVLIDIQKLNKLKFNGQPVKSLFKF